MKDIILDWNLVALETLRRSYTVATVHGEGMKPEQPGPVLGARALAITHLAMHDAFFGATDPAHPRYSMGLAVPAPTVAVNEPRFAVSAAAFTALSRLYPAQQPILQAFFALTGAASPANASHSFGVAVAEAILADRDGDPNEKAMTPYVPGSERGKHRVDPDNPAQGFYASDYGERARLFAATQKFGLAAPPFEVSPGVPTPDYKRALEQVKSKGIKPELLATVPSGQRRTADETLMGLFWAYDGAVNLGTPPRLYNQIVRQVAQAQGNTPALNAQLFALVNVALADAGIMAWQQKYAHQFWRPVVGIREQDISMGPGATQGNNPVDPLCDAQWLPLGAPSTNCASLHAKDDGSVVVTKNFTPNFPAYPSGHATFGAAALHVTRLFYGKGGQYSDGNGKVLADPALTDDLFDTLTLVSEECNGVNVELHGTVRPRHMRSFQNGLWQMIRENGLSRVYLGVHWVFDAFLTNKEGVPQLTKTDAAGQPYGGVPLGLLVAENIMKAAGPDRSPRHP